MGYKQRNLSVEDGVKRVEVQLQNFIEESVKRMDQIEEKQASYDTKMAEVTITTRRIEELLLRMDSQSKVADIHRGMVVEAGQSSVGDNIRDNTPPFSPPSITGNRVVNTTPPPNRIVPISSATLFHPFFIPSLNGPLLR